MSVNKFRLRIDNDGKNIIIPLFQDVDDIGQSDAIDIFEDETIEKVINPIDDLEVTRFSHKSDLIDNFEMTEINYQFHFFNREMDILDTNNNDTDKWLMDYNYLDDNIEEPSDFTDKELYYTINSFKRSFFKLDLYNSQDIENNKLMVTLIIPTQQGNVRDGDIGTEIIPNIVDIKIPEFKLDFIGNKEAYFIYWLKNPGNRKLDNMYMSAKFFNARTGQFVRMLNTPQSEISKKFSYDKSKYYYYRVLFDYNNFEYSIYNINTGFRNGTTTPIKWYEYVNPNDGE